MAQLNFCETCGIKRVRDVQQQLERLFTSKTYKPGMCGICEEFVSDVDHLDNVKETTENISSANSNSFSDDEVDKSEFQFHISSPEDHDNTIDSESESNSGKKMKSKGQKCNLQSIISDLDPKLLQLIGESDDPKQSFKCKFCEKKFAFANSFFNHINTHSGVERIEKPYKCNLCDARFVRRFHLKTHGRKHSDNRPFKCNYPPCTAAFKDKHTLAGHEETHIVSEKPYQCEYCSKAFRKRTVLETHKRIHTGDKPYMCKFCGFCCTQKQNLVTHERQHTAEKPYMCKTCDKGFYQMIQLQQHEMDHTGARPYVCEICGHASKAKSYLKQHMDTHRSERPYKCDRCDFTSKRRDNLRSHQRVHAVGKLFQCTRCNKMFKHKDSLKKHEHRHSRDPGGYRQTRKLKKANQILESNTKHERQGGDEGASGLRTVKDSQMPTRSISGMETSQLPYQEKRMLIPPHHTGYSSTYNTVGMHVPLHAMPHVTHHTTPHPITQTITHEYEPADIVSNVS